MCVSFNIFAFHSFWQIVGGPAWIFVGLHISIGFWVVILVYVISVILVHRSKGPCDVSDPWVRWERGQVGI